MQAVVLAGRANDGKLSRESQEAYEANIDIAGKPMVMYILDVLESLPAVTKIHLIGPGEAVLRYRGGKVVLLEPGRDLFDNVRIGLSAAETENVLVCASDVPLVTRDIMEDFLSRCIESDADFCYPVCEKKDYEKDFPEVSRTFVALKEGIYSGGNLFMVRKSVLAKAWPLVEKMISYRKSPLKMASVLGPVLLLKVFLKTASVRELERRVGALLDMKPRAILNAAPEIGIDVDKPSDLEICRRVLGK